MDPDETLDLLRTGVRRLGEGTGDVIDINLLVEHFEALDDWLSRGGHLPGPWAVRRPAVPAGPPWFASDQNRIGQ